MVRVKHCCCGCTLDIGARIFLWADLIATIVICMRTVPGAVFSRIYDHETYYHLQMIIVFIAVLKVVFLIAAAYGLHKKKPSYMRPYLVYNVFVLIVMATLILVAIFKFHQIVDSDFMDSFIKDWFYATNESGFRNKDEFSLPEENLAVAKVVFLWATIIGVGIQSLLWSYFTLILYSYYETMMENDSFSSINGVQYFAPGAQALQDFPKQSLSEVNGQPTYPANCTYATQPFIYPQAPPSYDEAANSNAFAYPCDSLPK